MTQTPRGYKVLWDTWKKAAIREYKMLVIIEDTMKNPGGGAPYIAGAKRAFATMYGDVPQAADLAVEPARMNWSSAMLKIANEQSATANWMITKMVAGVTMLDGDTRGRLHINGLAGLDVKVLTRTTTRDQGWFATK